MLKSILMGLFAIALISWAIGAYNRLVRLRAAMTQTYAVWHQAFESQHETAETPPSDDAGVQLQKTSVERMLLKDAYMDAVAQYNQAIMQIPAAWIATLFDFKPAHPEESKH